MERTVGSAVIATNPNASTQSAMLKIRAWSFTTPPAQAGLDNQGDAC